MAMSKINKSGEL